MSGKTFRISDVPWVQGEQAGVDFYFSSRSTSDSFRSVVEYARERNVTFGRQFDVHRSPGARVREFAGPNSEPFVRSELTAESLDDALTDDDSRVLRLPLATLIGLRSSSPNVLTVNGAICESARREPHAIGLFAEAFSTSVPGEEALVDRFEKKSWKQMQRLYRDLQPDYAAKLHEDSLVSPADLRAGHGKRLFNDFFISDRLGQASCGEQRLSIAIAEVCEQIDETAGVVTMRRDEGTYVAMTVYARTRQWKKSQAMRQRASEKIARLIGEAYG